LESWRSKTSVSVAGTAQPQAHGPPQELPVIRRTLDTGERSGKIRAPRRELFPRVGFIVTNLPLPNRAVVRFTTSVARLSNGSRRQAGGALTRLSCHRLPGERGPVQLSVLAYDLGEFVAGDWVLPRRIESWSLTSLQQRLVKTGGRLVKHARYYGC